MCEAIVGAWYPNGTFKKVASATPVDVDPVEQRWKKKPNTLYVSLDNKNAKIPTRAIRGLQVWVLMLLKECAFPQGGRV